MEATAPSRMGWRERVVTAAKVVAAKGHGWSVGGRPHYSERDGGDPTPWCKCKVVCVK